MGFVIILRELANGGQPPDWHGIGIKSTMPTNVTEASLINDIEFLDELARHQEHVSEPSHHHSRVFEDAFEALEAGLPVDDRLLTIDGPHHERAPLREHYVASSEDSALLDVAAYDDAFEALEAGLSADSGPDTIDAPRRERVPLRERYIPPAEDRVPVESRISFTVAAFVMVACFSVGAATAALVFHDRVSQISALGMASR